MVKRRFCFHLRDLGVTDISIAIGDQSDSALGTAANEANAALAQLRGTCNF